MVTAPGSDIWSCPLTEIEVADGATLSFVSVQSLGTDTWQLAHQGSTIGAHATLQSFAVALGGSYARLRTDSALQGVSGTSLLRAAFIGRDDQMLDFRTLQDHLAPRTTSDLLFMGAVADHAHSVYSGLIRVRRGAVRSDAMQTNHNLVLDEGAHADSVPNLDIEENDVRCSHGSTVGPGGRGPAVLPRVPGGASPRWPSGSSWQDSSRTSPTRSPSPGPGRWWAGPWPTARG